MYTQWHLGCEAIPPVLNVNDQLKDSSSEWDSCVANKELKKVLMWQARYNYFMHARTQWRMGYISLYEPRHSKNISKMHINIARKFETKPAGKRCKETANQIALKQKDK